jgi:hypothetical protein
MRSLSKGFQSKGEVDRKRQTAEENVEEAKEKESKEKRYL